KTDVLCAQRLERRRIESLLREELDRFTPPGVQLLAQRQQVLRRLLHDRLELLLLRLGGVDLDVQVLEHAIEMLVEIRGIDRSLPVPMAVCERLEADAGGKPADERRERDAPSPAPRCSFH